MRESVIEREVCKFAAAQGWLVRKMGYLGRRGCPDRWFFRAGEIRIVEFKAHGERPTLQQALEHARLADAGFTVRVVDSIEDGKALFR